MCVCVCVYRYSSYTYLYSVVHVLKNIKLTLYPVLCFERYILCVHDYM